MPDNAFKAVHAFDSFVSYDIKVKKGLVKYVTPLVRYDYMSDHSDGTRYLDGKANPEGKLIVNDYQRSRLTSGVTLSLKKPFVSDTDSTTRSTSIATEASLIALNATRL